MIEVWKETLLPGSMLDPKTGRQFTISEKDIRDAARNIRRMASRKGLRVPVIWEHQDVEENDPEEWKARYAKHTIGRLGDARRATPDDVRTGLASQVGTLLVRHDIYDLKDAEQLRKTGGVSPKIYRGYLDSTGEEYSGLTVAHSAATPSPVQWWQAPFSIQLSDSEALCLAYPHPAEDAETESCPSQDLSFDDWLAAIGEPDADEPAVELSATETPEEPPVADEPKDDAPKGGDGKNSDLKMIIDAIKKAYPAARIPDKVANWSDLALVLEAQSGGDDDNDGDEPEPEPEPEPALDDTAGAPGGGAPMMMSTLDKNPNRKKRALAWKKDELETARKRIEVAAKGDGRSARDPLAARKLTRRVESFEAVEMSFTEGEPTDQKWLKLVADIEAFEKSQPKFALKSEGVSLSSTLGVERPAPGGGTTPERGQLGADIILGKKSVKDA